MSDRSGLALLQRHRGLRRALVAVQQVICAFAIYTAAALSWRAVTGGSGRPSLVAVVAATIVVAVVLSRTRPAFERAVNWLAFGERADGYELATGFLKRLATSLDVDDVLPRLAETAAHTVGSQRGEVTVWLADGGAWKQTWPIDAPADQSAVTIAVSHSGDAVGELSVSMRASELSPLDRRLLDELAGPAGLALTTVRLTQALRQQAADIEQTAAQIRTSRARIVDARRGEQERFRAQLATRVRPHLDAARGLLVHEPSPESLDVDVTAGGVERAIGELRHLARELYPARLAEAGLDSAVRAWAEQTGHRVEISASGDLRRLDENLDVAAALYFCVVTALGNTGSEASATVTVIDGEVVLDLRLDDPPDGTAMQALSDRAEAFGGTAIRADGDGTGPGRVLVRVPLTSVRVP